MTSGISKTLPEPPTEQIKLLVEGGAHEYVRIKLKRQHVNTGRWSALPSLEKPPSELFRVEDMVREIHGGGRYRVEVLNRMNEGESLVQAFLIELEGAAKPLRDAPAAGGGMPFQRPAFVPPQGYGVPMMAPQFAPRFSRDDDDRDNNSNGIDPTLFFSMKPDEIAMQQTAELRRELREAREERKAEKAEADKRIERERERAAQLERQLLESQNKHERDLLNLKIEMAEKSALTTAPKNIDWASLAPAIAAFGTIVTGVIGLITTNRQNATALQQKTLELQSQQQQELMRAMLQKPQSNNNWADVIKVAGPVITPIIASIMEARSPSKVAELIGSLAEGQMTTLSMVAQMMKESAPEGNPMMDLATKVLEGIQTVAESAMERRQVQSGGPAPQSLPRQQARANGHQQQQPLTVNSTPVQFADAVFAAPQLPKAFRNAQWYAIIRDIHDAKIDGAKLGERIAQHLDACVKNDIELPAIFVNALEVDAVPGDIITEFMLQLPIAQLASQIPAMKQRMDSIAQGFHDMLSEVGDDGHTPRAAEDAEPEAPTETDAVGFEAEPAFSA